MKIYPYHGIYPEIASSVYLADYSIITGDVKIGEESSIWFHTVIRGMWLLLLSETGSIFRTIPCCIRVRKTLLF